MDSSPTSRTMAGTKRRAASLLPAFELQSSSPVLPRPAKRQARDNGTYKYPTPVPTSSTGIMSSSPPRGGPHPSLERTASVISERAPLASVPTIELNENGETLLMGRSSNSSHYQLSSNRLISRIHVKARYIPAVDPLEPNKIEIVCNGWNGLKVHCQGQTWELGKGDTFTSETESAQIMIDVQDARVLIQWPKQDRQECLGNLSDSSWDDESPTRPPRGRDLQSSPLRRNRRIRSPDSPSPSSRPSIATNLGSLLSGTAGAGSDDEQIQIYEDASGDDEPELPKQQLTADTDANASFMTEATQSFSSDLSEPLSDDEQEQHDPDEENDPIVHSFGPFGANLSNRMASIMASSPKTRTSTLGSASIRRSATSSTKTASDKIASATNALSAAVSSTESSLSSSRTISASTSRSVSVSRTGGEPRRRAEETPAPAAPAAAAEPDLKEFDVQAITNHVANQLAYSRLSSTPLSAILMHLPAAERRDGKLTKDCLRCIIESVPCIGTIPRQGKDAAGKPLESEYYYIPEKDDDEMRRLAVTDGMRKPSLRNCRKQHKQYYWKRPKTP
ncbi:hypothetical protein MAPG_04692 [Magnaporthiopsis poae ATCC 64411]|uniref:FHA domain-containing protein n=1 Tax=Magnaporthiopsis poae (strain ATCC 64411 / 73-15) TaxID=644358 RepID=A0A0C4DXE5_MAGP6|nr:hypothetical protein MAPG_04692 [Magnaporthiopsis poae ATCC 64411]